MTRTISTLVITMLVLGACKDDPVVPPLSQPAITAVSPAEGTGGTELRIDGSGFDSGATVRLGSAEAAAVELEAGSLFATAPAGLTGGTTYDVTVRNPDGGQATMAAAFTAVAPTASRVNGVSKPTGLQGMTIIIEGAAFGDDPALSAGKVFFENSDGSTLEAVIADTVNDWTDRFIVTTVPQGVSDTSMVRVETGTGVSGSIEFRLIQSGTFSPSLIHWTRTTVLPQPLQGLGAAFVPVEEGAAPANYVFTIAGADSANIATTAIYRATVQQTGELGAEWSVLTPLPAPRAYHATAAATGYTAALDTTTTAAYLYVLGGQDDAGTTVATVFRGHVDLTGELTEWSTARPLPQAMHAARALLFRGYLYITGGVDGDGAVLTTMYRAAVAEDGTLGEWEELGALPTATAYHSFVNFGPFLYLVGGDSTPGLPPVQAGVSGGEIYDVSLGRLNLRTGHLNTAGWTVTSAEGGLGKGRSKHSTLFAGGALFVTSGIYSGQAGSSENAYGLLQSDGDITGWSGATGSNTIGSLLGYHLYNQAAVSFIDEAGNGHVLVLGGAKRGAEGEASDEVVYY